MPSQHKLTFGSALQIHIGTFEHRFSTSRTDENPDLIPIYYFQHDVLGADTKMISGSLRGGYCPQRLANRH
jgi:hypothetical protein